MKKMNFVKSEKITIAILIDALGWRYIKNTGFLQDIMPYRKKIKTVLGYSCGVIPSILTGKYPDEHGRFNLFYLNPHASPFEWTKWIGFLPDFLLETPFSRKIIHYATKILSSYKGYFHIYNIPIKYLPYFDLCEKENIYESEGVPGFRTIIDFAKEKKIHYKSYSYHSGNDRTLFRNISRDLRNNKYDFIFMYLADLDAILHRSCNNKDIIHNALKIYEKNIKDLYTLLNQKYEEIYSFLFSDHGMIEIKNRINIMELIDVMGLNYGTDYIAMYDSTMARFWFMNNRAKKSIENKLATIKEGHFIRQEEKNKYHINFRDNRYGDSIFLMNPGIVIEPSYMGKIAPSGMHGFSPYAPDSYASFLSNKDYLEKVDTILDLSGIIKKVL
jgi:predicted AlkP superfamily pyrophosphatase or phosphodiesterase